MPLTDFDSLWDYQHPDRSEQAFLSLLPDAEQQADPSYYLQLLTQIARAQGLQRRFPQAHETLDKVSTYLTPDLTLPQIRYQLERGRILNSSGHPNESIPYFQQAWEFASTHDQAFYAIDAAHMLAIVSPPEAQISWNLKALHYAETSSDEQARKWSGSLYNNLGWSYHDQGDYEQALDLFQKAFQQRQTQNDPRETRIARWCIARTLRSLQRTNEALTLQQTLLTDWEKSGEQQDGYVFEEIAECLLTLGKAVECLPYFAQAYTLLSQDPWLIAEQAARLQRLQQLANNTPTLSTIEALIIQELETLLREKNILNADQTIPTFELTTTSTPQNNTAPSLPPTIPLQNHLALSLPLSISVANNSIVTLSLRDCTLTTLPESLANLPHLQYLDLRGNQLTTLPSIFAQLTQMQKIYLDHNQFTELPTIFEHWPHLTEIHLDHNLLSHLPENIGHHSNLTTLNLYHNQLSSIPETLSHLSYLQEIGLGHNLLTELPPSFWQLSNLHLLNIAENLLTELPEQIANLQNLHTLDLGHNQFTTLPEALGTLQNLTFYLYLNNNHLTELPTSLANLQNLHYLNISDNHLTTLPEALTKLQNLRELRLYNNLLTTLPTSLGTLSNLTELHAQNNQLTKLPSSIGNLNQLQKLDLSNNQLTELPNTIGTLSNLTELNLRNNKIPSLPESIGTLSNLHFLDLRANKLITLPQTIQHLTHLKKLDLRWNKILFLPNEIKQPNRTIYQ